MTTTDSGTTDDDEACIPVTPPEPATIEVVKYGIDPDTNKPMAQPLDDNSQFAVYAADTEDGHMSQTAVVPRLDTSSEGVTGAVRTADLYPGVYYLVETMAPSGYSLLAQPVKFTVKASDSGYTAILDDTVLTEVSVEGDTITMRVNDLSQGLLPASGGPGVPWYLALGSLVMILGFVWARKKTADARSVAFDA